MRELTARRVAGVLAVIAASALVLAYLGGTVAYAVAWSAGPTPGWALVLGEVAAGLLVLGLVAALGMGVARLAGKRGRR
jgi:hypothetical protein